MTRAIAIDPGITTGWALGLLEDGAMQVNSGQEKWDHKEMYEWLSFQQPDFIICERFEFRQRQNKLELFSRELIGICHLYDQQHEDVHLYMQSPGEALGGYYNNEKLRNSGVYNRGNPHANDAMRHLLTWFTFKEGYQFNQHGYR